MLAADAGTNPYRSAIWRPCLLAFPHGPKEGTATALAHRLKEVFRLLCSRVGRSPPILRLGVAVGQRIGRARGN